MFLSDYQLSVLKYLCRHGSVPYSRLSSIRRYRNKSVLLESVLSLKHQGLIDFVVPSSSGFESVDYFSVHNHLIVTISGRSIREDRRREFFRFFIPLFVTFVTSMVDMVLHFVL